MSEELLELLWVLEATLAMQPDLSALLEKVVSGPCFASEIPEPTAAERKPPLASSAVGGFLSMMLDDDAADDERGE